MIFVKLNCDKHYVMIRLEDFDFRTSELLTGLSLSDRTMLELSFHPMNFKKGSLIFHEDAYSLGVYIIRSGKAKLFNNKLEAKEQVFYIYRAGEIMGYHALLCDEPYHKSCMAIEDCETYFIAKRDFETLIDKLPHLKDMLIKNMSHEFGVLLNRLTVYAQKPLIERLALFLLLLEKIYKDNNGMIELAKSDLANYVGTTRESLSRLLHDFADKEWISFQGKAIRIQRREVLHAIASSIYSFH